MDFDTQGQLKVKNTKKKKIHTLRNFKTAELTTPTPKFLTFRWVKWNKVKFNTTDKQW